MHNSENTGNGGQHSESDQVDVDPLDLNEARATLVSRIMVIQQKMAALVMLKSSDCRRSRVDPLKQEL